MFKINTIAIWLYYKEFWGLGTTYEDLKPERKSDDHPRDQRLGTTYEDLKQYYITYVPHILHKV